MTKSEQHLLFIPTGGRGDTGGDDDLASVGRDVGGQERDGTFIDGRLDRPDQGIQLFGGHLGAVAHDDVVDTVVVKEGHRGRSVFRLHLTAQQQLAEADRDELREHIGR